MRRKLAAIGTAGALAAVTCFGAAAPARAQSPLDVVGAIAGATVAANVFGGRQYCWYYDGWRGPGWYWCGYAYRSGYGWGGGDGWHGWRRGGGGGGGYHGGGHPGGGFHGGGHPGGGHPGGGFHGGGHPGGGHPGGGHAGGGHQHH